MQYIVQNEGFWKWILESHTLVVTVMIFSCWFNLSMLQNELWIDLHFPDSSRISRPRLLIALENIATIRTLEHISRVFQAPNILPNWHGSQQKLMQIFITFFWKVYISFKVEVKVWEEFDRIQQKSAERVKWAETATQSNLAVQQAGQESLIRQQNRLPEVSSGVIQSSVSWQQRVVEPESNISRSRIKENNQAPKLKTSLTKENSTPG